MCWSVLECVGVCWSVLECVAVCCLACVLQCHYITRRVSCECYISCVLQFCSVLQGVAGCWECVGVCWSVLQWQCVASHVCCSAIASPDVSLVSVTSNVCCSVAVCWSVLQCVAVRCSVLQCVALCYCLLCVLQCVTARVRCSAIAPPDMSMMHQTCMIW